jgi:hypothetical protein
MIRGFQSTLKPAIDFNFYRIRDKAEIDLIVDGPFGFIPIEIKQGTKLTPTLHKKAGEHLTIGFRY